MHSPYLLQAYGFRAPPTVKLCDVLKCHSVLMQVRPKKAPVKQEFRPLTQEELLAEAAQTEIENTASVQVAFF